MSVAGPALAQQSPLEEFARDPILAVACVLLVVVSVAWIVMTRMIARNLKRAAARGARGPDVEAMRSPKDIWNYPP